MSLLFLFARFIILTTTQLAKKGDGGRSTTWIPSPWLVACGRRGATARRVQPPRLNLMRKSLSPAKLKPIYPLERGDVLYAFKHFSSRGYRVVPAEFRCPYPGAS